MQNIPPKEMQELEQVARAAAYHLKVSTSSCQFSAALVRQGLKTAHEMALDLRWNTPGWSLYRFLRESWDIPLEFLRHLADQREDAKARMFVSLVYQAYVQEEPFRLIA